jgi:hypothetical protein
MQYEYESEREPRSILQVPLTGANAPNNYFGKAFPRDRCRIVEIRGLSRHAVRAAAAERRFARALQPATNTIRAKTAALARANHRRGPPRASSVGTYPLDRRVAFARFHGANLSRTNGAGVCERPHWGAPEDE